MMQIFSFRLHKYKQLHINAINRTIFFAISACDITNIILATDFLWQYVSLSSHDQESFE